MTSSPYHPDSTNGEALAPIEIPLEALSQDALTGVIESFIEREGTDYGLVEISSADKMDQIRKQIETRSIRIVFDPSTESVTLLSEIEWKKWAQKLTTQ